MAQHVPQRTDNKFSLTGREKMWTEATARATQEKSGCEKPVGGLTPTAEAHKAADTPG